MRVLHIVTGLGLGGAETVLSRLVINTSDAIDHEVICLGAPAWYSKVLADAGIPVHHLRMKTLSLGGLIRIRRIIRAHRPDVVQCWMYRANLLGGLIGRMFRVPTIWNIRCSSVAGLGLGSRLTAYAGGVAAPWASDFVINCSMRSSELHRKFGYARAPGLVIPNGYDLGQFSPDDAARKRVRDELGISDDTFLLGSIARWDDQKDIPNLLAALSLAATDGVPVRCLLLGADLDEANTQLAQAIERSGCAKLVTILGCRPDVADISRAMDLHVLASSVEGFPNVVAETMACATVNVVTDVGDAALIVDDSGWVVPPRSPKQLADAIRQASAEFHSSPERWQERRAAARARIAENFSLERMTDAYVAIWNRFAGEGRGSHRR